MFFMRLYKNGTVLEVFKRVRTKAKDITNLSLLA